MLTIEVRATLRRYAPRIVVVTGSVGKTSTKDAVHAVVAHHAIARKSAKSFNSDVGVPLTILNQKNGWNNPLLWLSILWAGAKVAWGGTHAHADARYPEWLVLEVGADHPGDIRRLVPWLHPDVVVVTMEGDATPVHIAFFKDKKELVDEDHAIIDSMKAGSAGNALIVMADDPDSARAASKARGPVWSVGLEQPAAVRATHYEVAYDGGRPVGIRFRIEYGGNSVPLTRPGVIGRHHVYPSLAAVAVALSQGWNIVAAAEALSTLESVPGRMRLLEGIKGSVIIDDSYNASPVAVKAALSTLVDLKVDMGRRIAVLGDMRELGPHSEKAHSDIGVLLAALFKEGRIDMAAAVGPEARFIHSAALKAGMPEVAMHYFPDAAACAVWAQATVAFRDVFLVKGSQGVRLERIVKEIMAEPRDAEHLLVRQDAVWQER